MLRTLLSQLRALLHRRAPLCAGIGVALALAFTAASPAWAAEPWGQPYDVQRYRLGVQLDHAGGVRVRTEITLRATAPLSVVALDAVGQEPLGAWLVGEDGQRTAVVLSVVRPTAARDGGLAVLLPTPRPAGALLTLEVRTRRGPGALQGLREEGGGWLWLTSAAPGWARGLFPCHDVLSDTAEFEVAVEAPGHPQVVVAGQPGQPAQPAQPAQGDKTVGSAAQVARLAAPLPPQRLWLAIGALRQQVVPAQPVTLTFGGAAAPVGLVTEVQEIAPTLQRLFGAAPGSGVALLVPPPRGAVPWAAEGVLSLPARLAVLPVLPEAPLWRGAARRGLARELARAWLQGLLPEALGEAALLESLSAYAALRAVVPRGSLEEGEEQVRRLAGRRGGYQVLAGTARERPLLERAAAWRGPAALSEGPEPERLPEALIEGKGVQVWLMLEALLGEEALRGALAQALSIASRPAEGPDLAGALLRALRAARPGADEFARAWLQRPGHPVLTVSARYDARAEQTLLLVRQRPSRGVADPAQRWPIHLPVVLHRLRPPSVATAARTPAAGPAPTASVSVTTVVLTPQQAEVTLAVPGPAPSFVSFDPEGLVLAEIEDEAPEAALLLAARAEPRAAGRFQALQRLAAPLWQATGAGSPAPSSAAVAQLARALRGDPSAALRARLFERLAQAAGPLPTPLLTAAQEVALAPRGMDPEDGAGLLQARAGALRLLALVPQAGEALRALAADDTLALDLVGPLLEALVRRGDEAAFATALTAQGGRGAAYRDAVVAAAAATAAPERLEGLVALLRARAGEPALGVALLRTLAQNPVLRRHPALPAAVADLLGLSSKSAAEPLAEDLTHLALELLTGMPGPQARAVLTAAWLRADSARLRRLAALLL